MDDERIARLEERVSNWMETTSDYRKSLCTKLDTIMIKIDNMPCSKGHDETVDKQLNGLWWLVGISLIGVLSFGTVWGIDHNQLTVNTSRWERYFQHHPDTR